jgi:hypothetical protein
MQYGLKQKFVPRTTGASNRHLVSVEPLFGSKVDRDKSHLPIRRSHKRNFSETFDRLSGEP